MGETAAMLAHEVRNPLGAMELFTGLLLQDLQDRPDARGLAEQIAAGIADLNHLVTNLLEFTRTRDPRTEPVDCRALVEDALRYTVDLQATSRIELERTHPARPVVALADPDLLRSVLLNLIRNALQAMAAGGTLRVSTGARDGWATIAIADTGPGIPAAAREEIFRPFHTTRTKGTGLGLTVARGLVTAMGGTLALESEVGVGSTFSVTLPAARGEDA
jgi:signal transduction histidine kinase